jgi:hypothetical protein
MCIGGPRLKIVCLVGRPCRMKSPLFFIVSEGKNTATCREHTAICSVLLASTSKRMMGLTALLALAHSKAHRVWSAEALMLEK